MNNIKKILIAFSVIALGQFTQMSAECLGKVELAPAYLHLDILENNNTVKKMDMGGIRLDTSMVFGKGWTIRPNILYAKGGGELIAASLGFGRCIPLSEKLILTPTVGGTYTKVNTTIDLDIGLGEMEFRESFSSAAPYISLELYYRIRENFRIVTTVQYAWSWTDTHVKGLFDDKSRSEGFNFAALFEYDLNCDWSVNIGGAYNESMSKEKNGIRGYGAKLGIVRWF